MNLSAYVARASCSPQLREIYSDLCGVPAVGGLVRRLVRRMLPPGSRVWARVPSGLGRGLWLHADPRYEEQYLRGGYETAIQQLVVQSLLPGGVFYDVGAHIGFFSLLGARGVGEKGEVVAFEADPHNVARIREHVNKNALGQVRTVPCAVWSECRSLRFRRASALSSRNQGAVCLDADLTSAPDEIEVAAVSLDAYAHKQRPPTLIKIDVEGGEFEVLQGAARMLVEARPVLLCEVHDSRNAEAVEPWLTAKGYALEWLARGTKFPCHLLAKPAH